MLARAVSSARPEFLLVEHATWSGARRHRWGLPGGRIEWRERPDAAVCRELREELGIEVPAADLVWLGDHRYKQATHRIFGACFDAPLGRIDSREIAAARWFALADIEALASAGRLHAGFEYRASEALAARLTAAEERLGGSGQPTT